MNKSFISQYQMGFKPVDSYINQLLLLTKYIIN